MDKTSTVKAPKPLAGLRPGRIVDVVNSRDGRHEPAMVVVVYEPSPTVPQGTIDADVHAVAGLKRLRSVRWDPDMSAGTWHFLEFAE